jgi:nucleotide-binding universal stress UspA family protein
VRIVSGRDGDAEGWRQIAVIVDDSDSSRGALQTAVAVSRQHRARLTLIAMAARPWPTAGLAETYPYCLEADATEDAAALVRGLAATVPSDIPCTTVVRCGNVITEVVGVVREHRCDLVLAALQPARLLGGGIDRRRARRLMRRASVDVILIGATAAAPAGTLDGLMVGTAALSLPGLAAGKRRDQLAPSTRPFVTVSAVND